MKASVAEWSKALSTGVGGRCCRGSPDQDLKDLRFVFINIFSGGMANKQEQMLCPPECEWAHSSGISKYSSRRSTCSSGKK